MRPVRPKTPRKPMSNAKFKTLAKDPIEVYCRIRPLENDNYQPCVRAKDDKTVILIPPDSLVSTRSTSKEIHHSFTHVFDENVSQKELFDYVALPLVQDLLQGNDGLVFTYGITSSGKTHTMSGTPQNLGLLPRSLDGIFNSINHCQAAKYVFKPDRLNGFDVQSTAEAMMDQQKELGIFSKTPRSKRRDLNDEWRKRVPDPTVVDDVNPDNNYAVFVSYVQIYNNFIYDLLEEGTIDLKRPKGLNSKMLREDAAHNMYVFTGTETEVKSADEALELFYKGQESRRTSQTALNTESSRSHTIFTIRIVQAPLDPQGAEILQNKDQVIISQLSMVDLAGSERSTRTKITGLKLREAGNINASLMALRTCIEALRESQQYGTSKMVPYRESKLTHLFKTFFEGEGKIRMIVCVNPREDNYEETLHVMRFAEMTQDVVISRPTPVSTPTSSVLGLRVGRGNIYREAVRKAKEEGVALTEFLAPTVYSMGPDFPQLIITCSDDESVYINLIEFLAARQTRRSTLVADLERRQDDLRRNLIGVDKENVQLKQEKVILQMDLDAREQQVKSLERKLSIAEQNLETLQRKLENASRETEHCQLKLGERDRILSEKNEEMGNMRNKMHEKLASEKDRMRRILERRLAEKQAELERKMCFNDEKFRQLREILNADDWELAQEIGLLPHPPPSVSTYTVESVPPESRFTKAKSVLGITHGNSRQPSVQTRSETTDSVFSKENKPPSSGQKSIAIANPRHRRSQSSSGDVWIDHNPVGNLQLGTVLQPKMKKKRSVSKLEVKDVTKADVSKYVLTHQEQDSQGEMETQLFKADVIPSAGGGAQVIFNDVEKLRQVSPPPTYNLRKRSAENVPLKDVEDRCTLSMECHGLPSKVMRKTK